MWLCFRLLRFVNECNETDFYPLSLPPSILEVFYGSAKCVVLCMNIGCVLLRVLPTAYPLWNDYRL